MDLVEKFQIKSGMQGKVLNKPRVVELSLRSSPAGKDFAVVFVKKQEEVRSSLKVVTKQQRNDAKQPTEENSQDANFRSGIS